MERINFNTLTKDEFRGLERKAWNGTLDFSKFPAPEYKFFNTVQALGYRCRHGNIPAELLKDDIRDARDIYRHEREQLTYNIEAERKYHNARLRARELVNAIYKTNTKDGKLRFALECIELLIGEGGFAARNLKYLEDDQ